MEYSKYQLAIKDAFDHTNDNLLVNALAGSGKSFILQTLLNSIQKGRGCYLAFNKHIQMEMQGKIKNPRVKIYTLHSVGLQIIKHNLGQKSSDLDTRMIYGQIRDAIKTVFGKKLKPEVYEYLSEQFLDFYSKFRLNFFKPSETDKLERLVRDYALFSDPDFEKSFEHDLIYKCLAEIDKAHISAFEKDGKYDFTDMLYLPLLYLETKEWKLPGWLYFDVIATDETQDFSRAQALLTTYLKKKDGRIIIVGDVHQAIYLFAGATSNSIDYMKRLFAPCVEFDLPINYRCPSSHLSLINRLFNIGILPRPKANEGEIRKISKEDAIKLAMPNDMVIGRKNKWLIPFILECVKLGKHVYLKDKEFVDRIVRAIEKQNFASLQALRDFVEEGVAEYKGRTNLILNGLVTPKGTFVAKVEENYTLGREPTKQQISRAIRPVVEKLELYETIQILLNYYQGDTVTDFIAFIRTTINTENPTNCIYVSSIHGCKGLESDNVFVLNENEPQYQLARESKEQLKQEGNLSYIAGTRAMKKLYLVSPDGEEYA